MRTALREASRREAPLRTPPLWLRVFLVRSCCFFGFGNLVFQLWLTAGGYKGFGIPLTVGFVEKWVCAQKNVPCRKNYAAAWCWGRGYSFRIGLGSVVEWWIICADRGMNRGVCLLTGWFSKSGFA